MEHDVARFAGAGSPNPRPALRLCADRGKIGANMIIVGAIFIWVRAFRIWVGASKIWVGAFLIWVGASQI